MHRRSQPGNRRTGAALVESALVLTTTFLLLFGVLLIGMAVSYYQIVCNLAREATRVGSVRGGQFRLDAGLAAGNATDWATDIYDGTTGIARWPSNVTVNVADLGLNRSRLRYTFAWSNDEAGNPDNWPYRVVAATGAIKGNTITVRVEYDWLGFTLASRSTMQIAN